MRRILGLVAVVTLASCMDETPDPSDPQGRLPSQLSDQRQSCEQAGGQFVEAGLGGLTCVRPTADAGQSCTRDSECEDLCLADMATPADATGLLDEVSAENTVPTSGICATQTPTFGCHSIFRDDGEVVELCID